MLIEITELDSIVVEQQRPACTVAGCAAVAELVCVFSNKGRHLRGGVTRKLRCREHAEIAGRYWGTAMPVANDEEELRCPSSAEIS